MKRTPSFFLLIGLTLALIVSPTIAQDTTRPGAQPSLPREAEKVFARYEMAAGGRGVYHKVKSRVLKGEVEYKGVGQHAVAPAEFRWKAPDKFYGTIRAPFGEIRRWIRGARGWGDHPHTGLREVSALELLEDRRFWSLYQPALLRDLYSGFTYEGRQTVAGRDAEVVAAQTREGKTERFYFDAATHLPFRLDLWEQGPEGTRVEGEFLLAEYRLEDYRRVDGMMLPFRVLRVRPRSTVEYRFSEIRHDVEVDDQTFTPPPQKSKQ